MKTIKQLNDEISKLIKERDDAIAVEKADAIKEIKEKISTYSLVVDDIFPSKPSVSKKPTAEKTIKYRDGENTWSGGRGRKPLWVQAIIEAGEDIEKYKI